MTILKYLTYKSLTDWKIYYTGFYFSLVTMGTSTHCARYNKYKNITNVIRL